MFKKRPKTLDDFGPLYHEYSFFGHHNEQKPGIFAPNQRAKAPIITAYIAYAIAKSRRASTDAVTFTELFCADGYYAMVADRLGCSASVGIDNDRDGESAHVAEIASVLGCHNTRFEKRDIHGGTTFEPTDVVANVGGLYHVSDPAEVLAMSYAMATQFLIVQNVVSLATDDPDYCEMPAPGWTWGNRFSRQSFDALVRRTCPGIVDEHFNELEGNERPDDRGSAYYLIRKPG